MSSTDSSTPVDELCRLYERFRSAEIDEERREIALEMGALDRQRHAEIYEGFETE